MMMTQLWLMAIVTAMPAAVHALTINRINSKCLERNLCDCGCQNVKFSLLFFFFFFFFSTTVGLVEVTNIDGTTGGSTTAVISPGAIALKIVPPGILALDVSIASSDSWGTQQPQFDVLFMSDAQWTQFKDPLQNPGSSWRFSQKSRQQASTRRQQSFWSQPDAAVDRARQLRPGYGATPPSFSSLTLHVVRLVWPHSAQLEAAARTPAARRKRCTAGLDRLPVSPVWSSRATTGPVRLVQLLPALPAHRRRRQRVAISSPNQQTSPAGDGPTDQSTIPVPNWKSATNHVADWNSAPDHIANNNAQRPSRLLRLGCVPAVPQRDLLSAGSNAHVHLRQQRQRDQQGVPGLRDAADAGDNAASKD
jgi:hypothetical protein